MNQQTIPTTSAPELFIGQVDGDLQIKGWDRAEVNIKGSSDEVDLQEENDTIHLNCQGSIALRVPHSATIHIDTVQGEARVKLIEESLQIGTINGSLVLRNISDARVSAVHGGLSAKYIAGDLLVEVVNGDAAIRHVEGDCILNRIAGDLSLRQVEADVTANVSGDARLRLGELGGDVHFQADGSLIATIPQDASAELQLSAPEIRVSLPDSKSRTDSGTFTTRMADGEFSVVLSAKGSLVLNTWEGGADDDEGESGFDEFGPSGEAFNQEIARQIEAQVEAMTRQINEQISSLSAQMGKTGLSPDKTEEIMRRAQEASQRATQRAQERMRQAQERLERQVERSQRRSERHAKNAERRTQSRGSRSFSFEWPAPPPPPKEPISDEERLVILRMLEQKKISLEEAEQLLSALEGE